MGVYKYIFCNKMIISRQKLELRCLIIDMKYVNKQTMNMYINKQTTAKAKFNPNSIKNLFNMKTTFKCRLHIEKIFNRVWIEFSLSCCLFVYIHIHRLFVYIFHINNQTPQL